MNERFDAKTGKWSFDNGDAEFFGSFKSLGAFIVVGAVALTFIVSAGWLVWQLLRALATFIL